MLMGSETEFGILDGWSTQGARAIQDEIERRHAHLRATKEGVFLANGARVYVDQGAQNEYGTPEVDDPLLLVRHELAGRALMQEAAAAHGRTLLCSNLDYCSGNSWGTHENYACRAEPSPAFHAIMLTHLATRLVYCGAGGPLPDATELKLVLSPRAGITHHSYSEQGILRKSMIFRKNHHHGAGHRLHVFSGESLLCPHASWLKYGTTALVAACLDADLLDPAHLTVKDPVRTLHAVNRDLSLAGRQAMRDGAQLTAIEIQRRLAVAVAAHRDALPAWAEAVLAAWRTTLDGLARRDPDLRGAIDWQLYLRLWSVLAAEHGFAPEGRAAAEGAAADWPGGAGNDAERLDRLGDASRELYVRLHALSDSGPLEAARAAGWLAPPPRGLEPTRVLEARETAPAGRAGNRARFVREHAGDRRYAVNWDHVVDTVERRCARFPNDGEWDGVLDWDADALAPLLPPIDGHESERLQLQVLHHRPPTGFDACFRTGDYREAIALVAAVGDDWAGDVSALALAHARLGQATAARHVLATQIRQPLPPFVAVATELFCAVNYGLAPPLATCLPLVDEGERLLPVTDGNVIDADYHRVVFEQCRGRVRLYQGRPLEAIAHFRKAIRLLERDSRPRMLARTHCLLAEALRRNGDLDGARVAAAVAERIHLAACLIGDAADHLLPVQAKLAGGEEALRLLRLAEGRHRRRDDGLDLARALCLKARLGRDGSDRDELRQLQQDVEALRTCPLAHRILDNWDAWVGGAALGEEGDFWGL